MCAQFHDPDDYVKDAKRPCKECKMIVTQGKPDPCLGYLPDVAHACCGHGDPKQAYVTGFDGCKPHEGIASGKHGQFCGEWDDDGNLIDLWPNMEAYVLDENGNMTFDKYGLPIHVDDYYKPGHWCLREEDAIEYFEEVKNGRTVA